MSTRVRELPRAAPRAHASAARYLPAASRLLLLLLLGAALLAERPAAPATPEAAVLWLPAEGAAPGTALHDSLLVGTPPALLVRPATTPPTANELETLAAATPRAPLLAALPAAPSVLRVTPPPRPRVGRAAAIPFALLAAPGQRVNLRLDDEAGPVDSLTLAADERGEVSGAFRVRPSRAGWKEWSVVHGGQRQWTGGWVAEAELPRVLVVAGPPTWESRFTVGALEESGARVELLQPLGRGLELPAELATLPSSAAALRRFDAVLLLEGVAPAPAQSRALEEYASRWGGGVLRVGAPGAAAGEVEASRIRWSLPAELAPLPDAELRSATLPPGALPPAAVAGAYGAGGEPLLVLESAGRGRMATLALTESWRWRMEAGRVAEHREFWRSLVDWLASGVREATVVQVSEAIVAVGARTEVRVYSSDTVDPPSSLILTRPGGAVETLPLLADLERAGVLRSLFLPDTEGVYTLAIADEPVSAALRATDDTAATASHAWARLALLASASGGEMLDPDSLAPEVRRRTGTLPQPTDPPVRREPLLFALLLVLATTEWAVRRFTGRK